MNKNKNTKNERKFSIADLIIVITLIAVLSAILVFFVPSENGSVFSKTLKIQYDVEFERVSNIFFEHINVGDAFYDEKTGNKIGVISGVEYKDSLYSQYDPQLGYYRNYPYPDAKDVILTVNADASIKKAKYYSNGVNITAGKTSAFLTTNFGASGTIIKVSQINTTVSDNQTQLAKESEE